MSTRDIFKGCMIYRAFNSPVYLKNKIQNKKGKKKMKGICENCKHYVLGNESIGSIALFGELFECELFDCKYERKENLKMEIEISSWGKSMYGGWYIDYFNNADGNYHGVRFNTLKECLNALQATRQELKPCKRFDN